jgi:opacity protein-like surface antigen
MKGITALIFFLFILCSVSAQRIHVGVFGGLAAYNGDLVDTYFPKRVTNGAIGLTVNYELKDQIMLRGGFTYSVVGGADRYSREPHHVIRNLSFETSITEFSLLGEYYINNLNERRYSPYVFAGLAVYRFNPYAYYGNNKVYLKPLSTEGQGLPGYPDRKPYSLTQLAIPLGGGIKYAITDNWHVGLELGLRKLFTDHLDDAGDGYADPNDLLAAKGQLAVDISYRGDEVPGGNPTYPDKNYIRGNPKYNDWYYFFGLHLTYRLGNGLNSTGIFSGKNRKYGCPKVAD